MGTRRPKHTIELGFTRLTYTNEIPLKKGSQSVFMRIKKFLLIAFCFMGFWGQAQFHELGAVLGRSNYIGDVGSARYVYPRKMAYGVLYRYNVNTRYSLRAGFALTTLFENENNTNDLNRFRRGYEFENEIQEVHAGMEFNFVDFNLHDDAAQITPYLFLGLSYFRYDLLSIVSPNTPEATFVSIRKDQTFGFPVFLGAKWNPNPLFVIGLELGVRYTLTDNLDGSNPQVEFPDNPELKFGNVGNNDWFVFTGLTISFTFGDLPCYCKE